MTDLFKNQDENVLDQNKNYLEELVGDGKKFKSPEELAKGKATADHYIKTLETKLDELRNDYLAEKANSTATAKLQELIDQYEKKQLASNDTPLVNEVKNQPQFDPSMLDELVTKKIQETDRFKTEQSNYNTVQNKLKEQFGSNYGTVVKEQADTLGLTGDEVEAWARKSPEAFFRIMGLNQPKQETFQAPPRSAQRNDNFAPQGAQKRTWSYYQNMKKTNPALYHDPKINVQMEKDALELGSAFEDGDFHKYG